MADDAGGTLFHARPTGVAGSSAATASSSPPVAASAGVDPAAAEADAASGSQAKSGGRKRVFTFQKRWLHSLPIVERVLPDAPGLAASDSGSDVVVCMLCDDPASKRETPKVWNRLNCRRGRIENHLLSKHPEFMLLLKQKREAEGELAVQIFLQSMRDGRCNVRDEITTGLYAHLQTPATPSEVPVKRSMGFPAAAYDPRNEQIEADARRKRAKLMLATKNELAPIPTKPTAAMYPGVLGRQALNRDVGGVNSPSAFQPAPSSSIYQEAGSYLPWSLGLMNKVVVITGGESEIMKSAATQLWLLGVNVLITFSDLEALDDFSAAHIARFSDPNEHIDVPRGVMLPALCDFKTPKQIDEWGDSIAARFPRVHCLLNYVDIADDQPIASRTKISSSDRVPATTLGVRSTVDRLRDICRLTSSICLPADGGGFCTIVNVAQHVIGNGEKVEKWCRIMAKDVMPKVAHVNFVELPRELANGGPMGEDVNGLPSLEKVTGTLLHTIALLCASTGELIAGSIFRLHHHAHQDDKDDVLVPPLPPVEAVVAGTPGSGIVAPLGDVAAVAKAHLLV